MLYAYSSLLYAHSICGGSCSIYIMKAGFVALFAYMIKQCSSCHISSACSATLGTSMMELEQEKIFGVGFCGSLRKTIFYSF
jgi:hypothetical protein